MINQSSNFSLSMSPSLSLSMSLKYHHQPTITRSTHMDTKTITIPCTSTIYQNLYHTMYINPYHTMYINLYHTMHKPCISTMYQNLCHTIYINHAPKPVPYHVPTSLRSASNNAPYHHQLIASPRYVSISPIMYHKICQV
jgi:hypothetical protein